MDETSYNGNRNVFHGRHSHVVGCPKHQSKVLVMPLAERLKQIIREVCKEQ